MRRLLCCEEDSSSFSASLEKKESDRRDDENVCDDVVVAAVSIMDLHNEACDLCVDETKPLGEGSGGTVYRGTWKGMDVAVKYFDKDKARAQQDAAYESNMIRNLSHPHIVRFFACLDGTGDVPPRIVMERGEECVHDIVATDPARVTNEFARAAFHAILMAVVYLHEECNVAHRDIKMENMMILPNGRVVLVDFGLSKWFYDIYNPFVTDFVGSPRYAAPEILERGHAYDAFRADVWSLGIVFYVLLLHHLPFYKAATSDVAFNRASTAQRLQVSPLRSIYNVYFQTELPVHADEEMVLNLMLRIRDRADIRMVRDAWIPCL